MKQGKIRKRQVTMFLAVLVVAVGVWAAQLAQPQELAPLPEATKQQFFGDSNALAELDKLEVKALAPKTAYRRQQFGDGWGEINGCSVREVILARDLTDTKVDDKCRVQSGRLADPYTGKIIQFQRGQETSQLVQIDHVVALSDAWQKGAQRLSSAQREQFANDPLNLLAVDGAANQNKSNSDAAAWLPANKNFRCQYVARQVAVKRKYQLWLTDSEKSAMRHILEACAS